MATSQKLLLWIATQPRAFSGNVSHVQNALLVAQHLEFNIWKDGDNNDGNNSTNSAWSHRIPRKELSLPGPPGPSPFSALWWQHIRVSLCRSEMTRQPNTSTLGHLPLRFTWITKIIPALGKPRSWIESEAVCAMISFPLLMWAGEHRKGKISVAFSLSFHKVALIISMPEASLGMWGWRYLAEGIGDLWLSLLQYYTEKTKATGCLHLGHTWESL